MNSHALGIALFVPLILFSLYRRFRRNFGRQPIRRSRMILRCVVLVIAAAAISVSAVPTVPFVEAAAVGIVAGIGIGMFGLRLTRFEVTPEGEFYTPNLYIGIALSAMLIGRLIYRFFVVVPVLSDNPYGSFQKSPLTLALFALLIGYYVSYTLGILLKARRQQGKALA